MLDQPVFWVDLAFLFLIALVVYYKLPGLVGAALDKRAETIRSQLDEASNLREEAQALLASYQRKQRDAEKEAQEIIEHANIEAKRIAKDAEAALADGLARRARMAEEKIAQAEAQAVAEVRSAAITVATAAAREIIVQKLDATRAGKLVDEAIADLAKNLH
jgi:F-type H+-transporting ATPase subunit b